MAVTPNAKFLGSKCPKCDFGTMGNNDNNSEWWVKCDDCGALHFCYEPMPHQLRFHMDPAKFKMYAGGYGSAKTSTGTAEFLTLAFNTPNGVGLVGAHTFPQLERTAMKQVMDMLPSELIAEHNKSKNVIKLTNGYEIMFKSFDDEQKLRSLNLCHVYMEEANGTDFSIFTQLQTRLRHHATDRHKIIMSTNPDGNWVKTEILLKADRIIGAREKYNRPFDDRNPNIAVHIARTEMNTFLPPTYIDDIKVGKPEHWIKRYLEGSFLNAEGKVYPQFEDNIVADPTYAEIIYNIQHKGWKVIGGADFGLLDPTVLLLAALDPATGTVYIYDEYVKNRVSVGTHASEMKRRMEHIPLGSLLKLMGDPSGAKRNINDLKSTFNHYQEHGIYFQKGNNRIEQGIMKVFSYFEMGKLKVLSHLEHIISEGSKYMYKPVELGEKQEEKPIDIDNHTMDALRYLIAELPDDPMTLGRDGMNAVSDRDHNNTVNKELPWNLQEEETLDYSADAWYNNY